MQNLPSDVHSQAQKVLSAALAHCGELLGAYIHGSIALGSYVPGRSDLDLLIVCRQPMPAQARTAFADALLALHNAPCPIELSVLTQDGLAQTPPVCTFHFSSMWAPRYAAHDKTNPLLHADFPDGDIPPYYRVARQCGIRLYGPEAVDLLPEVSDKDFFDAICCDLDDYSFDAYDSFASNILTLPRILSFAQTRTILTKLQAAQWAMQQFPQYASLLTRAMTEYRTGEKQAFSSDELESYRGFFITAILKGLR